MFDWLNIGEAQCLSNSVSSDSNIHKILICASHLKATVSVSPNFDHEAKARAAGQTPRSWQTLDSTNKHVLSLAVFALDGFTPSLR